MHLCCIYGQAISICILILLIRPRQVDHFGLQHSLHLAVHQEREAQASSLLSADISQHFKQTNGEQKNQLKERDTEDCRKELRENSARPLAKRTEQVGCSVCCGINCGGWTE